MQKAQLSIELLIYVALSAISLTTMLYFFASGNASASSGLESAYTAEFVAAVNANMGYYHSSFAALVPQSICSANISATGVYYMGSTYPFDANVSMDSAYLCGNSGRVTEFSMDEQPNGTFILS